MNELEKVQYLQGLFDNLKQYETLKSEKLEEIGELKKQIEKITEKISILKIQAKTQQDKENQARLEIINFLKK
jgi:regulator of replication initiation timing